MPFAALTRAARLPKYETLQYRLLIFYQLRTQWNLCLPKQPTALNFIPNYLRPAHLIHIFVKESPKPFRESVLSCIFGYSAHSPHPDLLSVGDLEVHVPFSF